MSRRYRDKYIDLKINGRLFPSWVLSNFRQFKLPDMIKTDGDPCNASDSKAKLELRKYQLFFTKFLDFNSPYKNILTAGYGHDHAVFFEQRDEVIRRNGAMDG